MAIVRTAAGSENPVGYAASLAFFCCVSCVVIMLRFLGFRATINVSSKSTRDENVPVVCISGAYRTNREEFFESGSLAAPPKKITPAMVSLPPNKNPVPIRPSKSTNDVREPGYVPVMLNKSTPEISMDPRGGKNNIPEAAPRKPEKSLKELKKEEKEKIKLEEKQRAEQRARKKAAEEQAKKEKLKQQKEQAKQAKARDKKGKKTKEVAPPAPPPPPMPQNRPQQSTSALPAPNRPIQIAPQYTNTMQSNISRNSGPPPYSELPQPISAPQTTTSNVSFGKPINNATSSWDMVSQHRQQMIRPTATIGGGARKQMVMDLNYNFNNNANNKDNSEA